MAKKGITCKKCKTVFQIGSKEDLDNRKKEWTMVAPMPDKDGNVTITMMATWNCPNCGKNITGSYGKTKGDFAGKSRKDRIEEKLNTGEQFKISEFSNEIGVDQENLEKILAMMIKKGQVKGKISGGSFIPG